MKRSFFYITLFAASAFISLSGQESSHADKVRERINRAKAASEAIQRLPKGDPDTEAIRAAFMDALDSHGELYEKVLSFRVIEKASEKPPTFFGFVNDPFKRWESREMDRSQFIKFLADQRKDAWVPLASGERILADKVMFVSPAGVRAMTDNGVEVIPWDAVDESFRDFMGWKAEMSQPYQAWKLKAEKENNAESYKARMRAIEAENRASADAGGIERAAKESAARDVQATGWPADPHGLIRSEAEKEWPADFSMQEHTIKRETEALMEMRGYIASGLPGLPTDVSKGILLSAIKEWPRSFAMMAYKSKREAEAWRKLNGLQ